MDLSVIIVNYNSGTDLRTCLFSLYRETKDIHFEVIVVDNASTDKSIEGVESEFPSVKVIHNSQNRGFAAANNIALRMSAGEYILLLNPDTNIMAGAIQRTMQFMERHSRIGITGCKLLYANGSLQESVRAFPSPLLFFLEATFLYLLLPKGWIVSGGGLHRVNLREEEKVDWVIGAFFMFRRTLLGSIGLLDEQFWIYGEEVDYCRRARDAGFETWFYPKAEIIHNYGGMTTFSVRGIVWLYIGHKLYIQKHFHGFRKYIMLSLKFMGALSRVFVYPVIALFTWDGQMLNKAFVFWMGFVKGLSKDIRYDPTHPKEVRPWTQYV
jgi:GT2 family glycosyltransferase